MIAVPHWRRWLGAWQLKLHEDGGPAHSNVHRAVQLAVHGAVPQMIRLSSSARVTSHVPAPVQDTVERGPTCTSQGAGETQLTLASAPARKAHGPEPSHRKVERSPAVPLQ
jgi:hypothetical protein